MNTDEVLTLLRDVADEVINPRFRSLSAGEVGEKNPGDLVTVADHEAEELITRALAAAYPDAVVLGEEAFAADPGLLDRFAAAEHAFTVDPVDGTKNFVHGSPDHAVMVGETRSGVPVRGWIWQPQHELAYVAERGAGAWCGDRRLTLGGPAEPLRGRTSRRSWVGRALDGLDPMSLTWVSCGIDYPKLAEGEADYVVYRSARPWDHVPGSLLLAEAGGVVGTTGGQAYDPREEPPGGLVAAGAREAYDRVVAAIAATPDA